MKSTYFVIVTLEDVYKNAVQIPFGYNMAGFRPPKKGDNFISVIGNVRVARYDLLECQPRIILKKETYSLPLKKYEETFNGLAPNLSAPT